MMISGTFGNRDKRAPLLLVHGGAWNIPDQECAAHRTGLIKAIEKGKSGLLAGKNALLVVSDVVAEMESDGAFDAGCGAVLTSAGRVELDAGIMDGPSQYFGAVSGIAHFKNPIQIAKAIVDQKTRQYCYLGGSGAEAFARSMGFDEVANEALVCERERLRFEQLKQQAAYHTSHPFLSEEASHPKGTVGCVVRDVEGRLAAGTSTGGTPFSMPGRIGDSPLPGCGFFANEHGAASATGWGEAIASVSLCYEAVRLVANQNPEEAARTVISHLAAQIKNEDEVGAAGGVILLNKDGLGGFAFSSPRMARGGWCEAEGIWADV